MMADPHPQSSSPHTQVCFLVLVVLEKKNSLFTQASRDWSIEAVGNWLKEKGLKNLVALFEQEQVNGQGLLAITSENVGLMFPDLKAGVKLQLLGALTELTRVSSLPGLFLSLGCCCCCCLFDSFSFVQITQQGVFHLSNQVRISRALQPLPTMRALKIDRLCLRLMMSNSKENNATFGTSQKIRGAGGLWGMGATVVWVILLVLLCVMGFELRDWKKSCDMKRSSLSPHFALMGLFSVDR